MWNPFKRLGRKESRTTSVIVRGTGGAIWTPNDYENFAKETYLKNVIAYRCISMIARSVASVPWYIYSEGEDGKITEVPNHPFYRVLERANPDESWSFFVLKSIAYLVMSGNCFLEKVGPVTGPNRGKAREIYSLRPDRMTILTDPMRGRISGYKYTVGVRSTEWERDLITGACDILQIKDFNPVNDFWGASATESAAREIDTSNEATNWNKKLLENEGRPGMLFIVKGMLTDAQYDRLEKKLKEDYGGAANAGKSLIIDGDQGADVKPYGYSPSDLEFTEGGRELARRIAFAYGVPPMLVGIPGDNTYSNQKEARQAFWEDTVVYYLNYFSQELNFWLFNDETNYLSYSLDDVPALAPKRESKWKTAQDSDFLTINEKRVMVGLAETEGGDVILVPGTMIPLSMAGFETDMNEEEDVEEEGEGNDDTE